MINRRYLPLLVIIHILFSLAVIMFSLFSRYIIQLFPEAVEEGLPVLTLVAIFSTIIITTVEFISLVIFKRYSLNTTMISFSILTNIIFSYDVVLIFMMWGIYREGTAEYFHYIINTLRFMSFVSELVFFYRYFVYKYKLPISSYEHKISIIYIGLIFAAYILASFFKFDYIVFIFLLVLFFYWLIKFYYMVYKLDKFDLPFVLMASVLCISVTSELVYSLARITDIFTVHGVMSFGAINSFFLFFVIYIDFMLKTSKSAIEKDTYERKVKELQINVLKNQISPHFIFNALNVVKTLYMTDVEKGNIAMDLLSKHLREYVNAANTHLIPFERELNIIESYLELENMKVITPFNIIYNIDAYNFQVPYFSLQPLIENIVRYSKINEKEDGYIEIDTSEDSNSYIIDITDNGCGFDANNIAEESKGIKNCKERFEILLNAKFIIKSAASVGTNVKIIIPKEKGRIG